MNNWAQNSWEIKPGTVITVQQGGNFWTLIYEKNSGFNPIFAAGMYSEVVEKEGIVAFTFPGPKTRDTAKFFIRVEDLEPWV